ncbi:hypothetical protein PR048_010793 [Dryococelus australis]|uniref:Reverse transcriptase n=1 Tax=Dryococelus australis TaxID=614101 RepID=A0ABQ9I453_9NEOP|nr:hypothetical protein PR048_010793 [Dryococelus australis]
MTMYSLPTWSPEEEGNFEGKNVNPLRWNPRWRLRILIPIWHPLWSINTQEKPTTVVGTEAILKKLFRKVRGSPNSVASKAIQESARFSELCSLGRLRTIFNKVQENQLVEYLQTMDTLLYGLTRYEFKKQLNSSLYYKWKSW